MLLKDPAASAVRHLHLFLGEETSIRSRDWENLFIPGNPGREDLVAIEILSGGLIEDWALGWVLATVPLSGTS